jgi:hypothetical protein
MTREEFDELIKEVYGHVSPFSWAPEERLPLVKYGKPGRCRYCGNKTPYVYVGLNGNKEVITNTLHNIMEWNNFICSLDCLYEYYKERQAEMVEWITR